MTQPRTSIVPTGTPGTVPSVDPDCPPWEAIRDAEGHVWVHFYAGIWDRLVSPEMTARFVPNLPTLYIAGPMSGLPDFNYPAFRQAADDLRSVGYGVLNPIDVDAECPDDERKPWQWYMRRTIKMLMDADAVATLPGWSTSRGANVEVDLAGGLGMRYAPYWQWLDEAAEAPPERAS